MTLAKLNVVPTKVHIPKEDEQKIFEEMSKVFSSGMLTLGNFTKRFEESLSAKLGGQRVIAVNSGSGALEIAGMALGLQEGEVIIPSNTFVATAASFTRIGSTVVYGDCDPKFGALTLEGIKKSHSERTKAVVVVHIGGIIAPEIKEIAAYCKEHNLFLIEDAAHAIGSTFEGEYAGTFGDIATFSFYPTKVITSGEGGCITTNDPSIEEECRIYRDQGKKDFNTNLHVKLGSNWRLSEIHAILGYYQLHRLDEFITNRAYVAESYRNKIKHDHIEIIFPAGNSTSNWYKAIAILDENIDRDIFKKRLAEKGVRCGGEVYNVPCHLQPNLSLASMEKIDYTKELPNTISFAERHICLPISAVMEEKEINHVCKVINEELTNIELSPVG
jgi:perosamine synthetase